MSTDDTVAMTYDCHMTVRLRPRYCISGSTGTKLLFTVLRALRPGPPPTPDFYG